MPDPAEQLQALYIEGFDLATFERYPNTVGVVRGECIALLVSGPEGLQMLGTPGWRIDHEFGVLTTVGSEPVFQFKDQLVPATEERRATLSQFRDDLLRILHQ
jgi:hypothetical protein